MFFENFAIAFGILTLLCIFFWMGMYPNTSQQSERVAIAGTVFALCACFFGMMSGIDYVPRDIVYKEYKVLDRVGNQYKTWDGWYSCSKPKSIGDDITVITRTKWFSGYKYIETE